MVLNILTLLGSLALFLYGLHSLSAGLKRILGDKIKLFIPWMSEGKGKSVLAGAGMTAAILTSKSSTASIVSLVSAGTLTLAQAIYAIMGANIGTTITAWIISVFGFTLNVSALLFPFIAIGFVCTMTKRPKVKMLGEIVMNFCFILLGIQYTLTAIDTINETVSIGSFLTNINDNLFVSILVLVVIGTLLSTMFQSSSAVVILAMAVLANGWLTFNTACALVLGANIGTTLTTMLVSSNSDIQARQAALVHFLFNLTGAVLVLILFKPFIGLIGLLTALLFGTNPATSLLPIGSSAFGLCIFHTLFNTLGTCMLIWFTDLIIKLLDRMYKAQEQPKENLFKYISAAPIGAPAFSISQALRETVNFCRVCYEGFSYVGKAINETDPDNFEEIRTQLVEYEKISDRMELGIANFLDGVGTNETSQEEESEIRVILRIIGELESLGDSGENISRIMKREQVHNMTFDADAIKEMNLMISKVDKAYKVMISNMELASQGSLTDIANAYSIEDEINDCRNRLRNEAMNHIEMHSGNYLSTNYFLDIISELEAMGDFMINVSQAAVKSMV